MALTILFLRLGTALTMMIFGIQQLVHPEQWLGYVPQWLKGLSPLKPESQMRLHALGNVAFGLLLASGWLPIIAVWIALIWWITILPFAFYYNWKIGLRDLTIIFAVAALLLLLYSTK